MLTGLFGLNRHLRGYAAGEAAPGGALIFELWRHGAHGEPYVRIFYVAQTPDQLRSMTPLDPDQPPAIAAIRVPGCADTGSGCPLRGFTAHVLARVAPAASLALSAARRGGHFLPAPSSNASRPCWSLTA